MVAIFMHMSILIYQKQLMIVLVYVEGILH